MLALTIWQPYASLIIAGRKRFETRPARLAVKPGETLAIHAGMASWREIGLTAREQHRMQLLLEELGLPGLEALPRGVVIGTVIATYWMRPEAVRDGEAADERWLGDYSPGRWVLTLREPRKLETPVYARGQQGLWHWDETQAVAAETGNGQMGMEL